MFDSIGSISAGSTALGLRPASDATAPGSRAVAVVSPAAPAAGPAAHYRPAVFLAHLLATREQAPQWRVHRRSRPDEAIAAYAAAAALPVRKGATFSRDF